MDFELGEAHRELRDVARAWVAALTAVTVACLCPVQVHSPD